MAIPAVDAIVHQLAGQLAGLARAAASPGAPLPLAPLLALALLAVPARPAPASQPPLRAPLGGARAQHRAPSPPGPRQRPRFKALGAFAAAAAAALWLGISLLGAPAEEPPSPAEEAPPAEEPAPVPRPSPMLSFRIEPPPPVIVNPDVEEFLLEIPDAGAAADGPARDAPSGAPDAAAGVNGEGPFPPPGAMITGAGEMAPVISRMEPLGRRLDPANPVPKAVRIELKPPVPEEEAMTRRPRLTPPPRAPSGPPVQEAAPPVGEKRRYTVIAGSYIKEANAERQRDRLEQEGLPAEVVHVVVNNQPYWRVMSGVFEDHEAAEAYGRELKRRNLTESPYIKLL